MSLNNGGGSMSFETLIELAVKRGLERRRWLRDVASGDVDRVKSATNALVRQNVAFPEELKKLGLTSQMSEWLKSIWIAIADGRENVRLAEGSCEKAVSYVHEFFSGAGYPVVMVPCNDPWGPRMRVVVPTSQFLI